MLVRPPLAQAPWSQEKCVKEQVREREGGILNEDQARLGNRRWNRYGAGLLRPSGTGRRGWMITVLLEAKPGLTLGQG